MNFSYSYLYYISIALQAICALHCIRKGNQQKWLWIIIFVPFVGCIIYFFSEIVNGNKLQQVQLGVGSIINPSGSVRKLEKQLKFSDTFQNRIMLADAYLANGQTEQAIVLYEQSLTGVFTENEHLLSQMVIAYSRVKRYSDVIPLAQRLAKTPQFTRSQAHLQYAIALGNVGRLEEAEKEFKSMYSKFASFEPRCCYGLFLMRTGRKDDAQKVFNDMLNEANHLSYREKRDNSQWFSQAKEALRSMNG